MIPASVSSAYSTQQIKSSLGEIIKQDRLDECIQMLSQDPIEYKQTDKSGRTILIRALESRSVKIAHFLLSSRKVSVEQVDACRRQAIHYACERVKMPESEEIIEQLIAQNADPFLKDSDNLSALDLAIIHENKEVVFILLEKFSQSITVEMLYQAANTAIRKSSVLLLTNILQFCNQEVMQYLDNKGMTLLHHAVESGKQEMVEALLNNGAEKDIVDSYNRTPLSIAYENNFDAIADFLLKRKADTNRGTTVFHAYTRKGANEIQKLLSHGLSPQTEFCPGQTIQDVREVDKDLEKIVPDQQEVPPSGFKSLFAKRTEINIYGQPLSTLLQRRKYAQKIPSDPEENTYLHKIVLCDQVTIQQLVAVARHDWTGIKNSRGETPYLYCARVGAPRVLKRLVSLFDKNDTDATGNSAQHLAAETTMLNLATLITKKEDTERRNNFNQTPLHLACQAVQLFAVKILTNWGADVNAQDSEYRTPFHYLALSNPNKAACDIASQLLDRGAIIDHKDKNDTTAFELAAASGNSDLLQLFLQRYPDLKKTYGNQALRKACMHSRYAACQTLLEHGVMRDSSQTLAFACQQTDEKIVRLLVQKKLFINGKKVKSKPAKVNKKVMGKNGRESFPLFEAVESKQVQVAKVLLENKAKVSKKVESRRTLIETAIQNTDIEMLKLLSEQKSIEISQSEYDSLPSEAKAFFNTDRIKNISNNAESRSRSNSVTRSRSGSIIKRLSGLSLSRSNSMDFGDS